MSWCGGEQRGDRDEAGGEKPWFETPTPVPAVAPTIPTDVMSVLASQLLPVIDHLLAGPKRAQPVKVFLRNLGRDAVAALVYAEETSGELPLVVVGQSLGGAVALTAVITVVDNPSARAFAPGSRSASGVDSRRRARVFARTGFFWRSAAPWIAP